jgi:predicted dehydrogenase
MSPQETIHRMHDLAIVGLGRVGSDYDAVPGPFPRSHIGAALAAHEFRIRWLVDQDNEARTRAKARWPQLTNVQWLSTIAELPPTGVEVIAFCTPPNGRWHEIESATKLGARVVIAEKPLCHTAAEALQIAALVRKSGVSLRVNFHRRFDPAHARMKALCSGIPRLVTFRYGKGLFNYGSHAIDLLLDWFGPFQSVQALDQSRGADPNLSVLCRARAGFDAYLLGVDGLGYDQFDADLLFADRRIDLANGGVERRVYGAAADRFYPGYAHLDLDQRATEIGPVGGLSELYQAVAHYLTAGAPLPGCTAREAALGLSVIETALRSRDAGGRRLALPDLSDEGLS